MQKTRFEIFKTNVHNAGQAGIMLGILSSIFPLSELNFDLDDPDCILRVKGGRFSSPDIIQALNNNGYGCEVIR